MEIAKAIRLHLEKDFPVPADRLYEARGTRLSVTQENFTDQAAVQPHREGWDKALNDLYQFLSKH
jgi:hypothetical protein